MKKQKSFWAVFIKMFLLVMLVIFGLVAVFLICAYVNNIDKLKEEEEYMTPPGDMVEIDGHKLHVMHEGNQESEKTLVFIHSNKTVDDSIALAPLMEELASYELIYVDRSGYGFSESTGASKEISSLVEETRQAVKKTSKNEKYILVPSKTGGIIAFYWAKTYPDEIEAIIGLEMYYPGQYAELSNDNDIKFYDGIMPFLIKIGVHRYAKTIFPTDEFGIYTERQMRTRDALIAKGLYTEDMYKEDKALVKNAKAVYEQGFPDNIPMYLIYANPFMDPYLHLDKEMLEIKEEIEEDDPDFDCVGAYNAIYRDELGKYENIILEEISAPERLPIFQPDILGGKIRTFLEGLE